MIYVIYALHIVTCLFLIIVVLLQQGKGADRAPAGLDKLAPYESLDGPVTSLDEHVGAHLPYECQRGLVTEESKGVRLKLNADRIRYWLSVEPVVRVIRRDTSGETRPSCPTPDRPLPCHSVPRWCRC